MTRGGSCWTRTCWPTNRTSVSATTSCSTSITSSLRVQTSQHDGAFQSSVATALQDRFEGSGTGVASIRTTEASHQAIRNQFDVLIVFLAVVATLLAIVGALSLM